MDIADTLVSVAKLVPADTRVILVSADIVDTLVSADTRVILVSADLVDTAALLETADSVGIAGQKAM